VTELERIGIELLLNDPQIVEWLQPNEVDDDESRKPAEQNQ
jgi:hypothetical protein